jgi:hypothetical protein
MPDTTPRRATDHPDRDDVIVAAPTGTAMRNATSKLEGSAARVDLW